MQFNCLVGVNEIYKQTRKQSDISMCYSLWPCIGQIFSLACSLLCIVRFCARYSSSILPLNVRCFELATRSGECRLSAELMDQTACIIRSAIVTAFIYLLFGCALSARTTSGATLARPHQFSVLNTVQIQTVNIHPHILAVQTFTLNLSVILCRFFLVS